MFDNTLFFQSSLSGLGERYKKEYSTSGTSMAAIKVNIQKFPCFLLNNGWMCVCVCVFQGKEDSGIQWVGGKRETSKLKNYFLIPWCTPKLSYTAINFDMDLGRGTYTDIF